MDQKMDLKEEQEIIKRIPREPQLFGILFDTYYSTIYHYTLKRVADPMLAQDIVSETFFKATKNISKFEWQGHSICYWFYRIASNEIKMYFRKNNVYAASLEKLEKRTRFEAEAEDDLVEELIQAQAAIEQKKEFLKAHKLLLTLSIKYQEVIILRFMEEKKIREVAFILDKKVGTVKSLISRALVKLRAGLEEERMQLKSEKCIKGVRVDETEITKNPKIL